MPEIPNFTSAAWQARRKDADLVASVLDGKGTAMPPFRDRIGSEQAQRLVAYLRSFDARRKNGAEDPSSDFEQRFRRLREEWQELRIQFREVSVSIPLP